MCDLGVRVWFEPECGLDVWICGCVKKRRRSWEDEASLKEFERKILD